MERWQDERVFGVNREPTHVPLRAHEDAKAAHAAQVLNGDAPPPSRWLKPLTPSAWAFNLVRTPASAPSTQLDVGFDTSDWGVLDVPLSLEAAGYGQAQYTNVRYPFPLQPPHIPEEGNHVGSYQTTFELPDEWRGRRVLLEFDGTGPAATVWLNGREVGYTQDWALPAEFDVTRLLAGSISRRTHVLSVQVMRWCDGSYLEAQDQWWFSGIHRHVCAAASSATTHERGLLHPARSTAAPRAQVRLYSKPSDLAICDYSACTTSVATDGASAALSVTVRLGGLAAHEAASDAAAGVASAVLARHRVRASLHGPYELTLDAPPPDAPEVWRSASVVALVEGGGSGEGGEGGLLCGGAEASFVATIAMPRLWAAEAPALYTLVLELLIDPAGDDSSGDGSSRNGSGSGAARGTAAPAVVDVEACRVGLRLVSISGEQLRVNGVPLEVRGVNRHEHSAERGKAVSWAEMVTDALLLKRFNFNAVRTSHYPNAVRLPPGLVRDHATCPCAAPLSTAPARACPYSDRVVRAVRCARGVRGRRGEHRDARLLLRALRRRGRARQASVVATRLSCAAVPYGAT